MLQLEGWFDCWLYSACKRRAEGFTARNSPTTEGLQDVLSVYFNGGTQSANWYCGLIANASYTGLDPADTLASHAGWTEEVSYSQSARVSIGSPSVAGGILLTANMQFSFAVQTILRGFFLANNSTKGGTTGKLWNTALLAAPRTIAAGASLQIVYKLRATGGSTS